MRLMRRKRDARLQAALLRAFTQDHRVLGVRKLWHQGRREGFAVARCAVERLTRADCTAS